MYILMKDLCDELNQYSRILIYGVGYYANLIYQALKKAGLRDKIDSFIVTNLNEIRDIDGINVNVASKLALYDHKETGILIAVNRENEREIVKTIQQDYGFAKGIKLLDYIIQDENNFYEKLRIEDDKWFFDNIIGWYIWNHSNSADELEEKRKETEKHIRHRNMMKVDKNTIVFISGDLKPRSAKIIAALVKRNYHIVVLEYGFCNELVKQEIMSCNVEFFSCTDSVEVFYRALQYKPLVYYFEPLWGDCSVSDIMIKHKSLFGRIVFAPYDVLNDGLVQISKKDKLMERNCLENADGIVWRWFSKEFLEEEKGFVYKGKSIQFLDYCKGIEVIGKNKSDDILKICSVQGGIYHLLNKSIPANERIYAEQAKLDIILEKIGNLNDCIFHAFIGQCNDSDRKSLDKLEKEYSNIKFFYGIEYNELISKISEYDYGCYFMTAGQDIPAHKSIDNMYYGSIHINSVLNRFFDYLDAGMPIITTSPKKLCEYLERYNVIVNMNISNLNIDFLKKNKMFYKENAKNAKRELLMENHIQRLIDWFYEL